MNELLLRCCHHIAPFHATDITPATWAGRIGHFQFRRSTSGFPVARPQAEHDAMSAALALCLVVRTQIHEHAHAREIQHDALKRAACRFLAPWSDDDPDAPQSFDDWCADHGRARYRVARGDWDRFGRTTAGPGRGPDFTDEDAEFIARQEALRLARFIGSEITRARHSHSVRAPASAVAVAAAGIA